MASGPNTSQQIDGKQWKHWQTLFWGGSKITADGDFSHEIKRCLLLGRKAVTNLDCLLKSKTLCDINHNKILYDTPPRILEIKAKINKWDLMKPKSFCTTKKNISKVKRQPSEWEKIIANEETDKWLISKIYKQHLQLNSRKINDPIKKWAKELNRHFSKED